MVVPKLFSKLFRLAVSSATLGVYATISGAGSGPGAIFVGVGVVFSVAAWVEQVELTNREAYLSNPNNLTQLTGDEKDGPPRFGNWSKPRPTGRIRSNSVKVDALYCLCPALAEQLRGVPKPPANWLTVPTDFQFVKSRYDEK